MEALIAAIATTGNIAVIVLVLVLIGLWRLHLDDRKAERLARQEDNRLCADAVDRQTLAVRELTAVITDLRIELSRRG